MNRIDWTRRSLLSAMTAAIVTHSGTGLAASYCSDPDVDAASRPLKQVPLGHASRNVRWGVAIEAPALYDFSLRAALAAEQPRFLAIADALKFDHLYPVPPSLHGADPTVRWGECDDVVAFATELGVPVRGDCLVWNDWIPDWLKEIAARRDSGWRSQIDMYLDFHIKSVFAHMNDLKRDRRLIAMPWCGVVNEPFNPWLLRGGTGGWRTGTWLDAFGFRKDGVPTYIHRAFELAEQHRTPATALFLNEAHCENDHFGPLMRPAFLQLVDALQAAGRKVDAVGLECHLMPQWMNDRSNPDWGPFKDFLHELAKRNVQVFITELDVIDCSVRDKAARDMLVAHYMGSFVTAALETGTVDMVTNWDFSDKYSWLRSDDSASAVYPSLGAWASCIANPPCPRPDLYDQSMGPKPARDALAKALASKV